MNITLLRWFDATAGFVLCILVLPFVKLLSIFKRPGRINNILVIKFFGMGSLIQGYSAFLSIRKKYPEAKLHIATFKGNKEILSLMNLFDHVLSVNPSSIWSMIGSFFGIIIKSIKYRYDVVIDMEFFSNGSTFLACLTGAPQRIGFYLRKSARELLLTKTIYYNSTRHIISVYMALARAVGAQPIYSKIELKPDLDSRKKVKEILNYKENTKLVIINPNASKLCLERRWPKEKFAHVIDYLAKLKEVKFAIIGDKNEAEYSSMVYEMCKNKDIVINVAGKLTISTLIELFSISNLLISNDSGPVHIANTVGTPVVALFGPENPFLYGPVGEENAIFYTAVYCSPCLNMFNYKVAPCKGNNICMKLIDEQFVAQTALTMLNKATSDKTKFIVINKITDDFSDIDWTS